VNRRTDSDQQRPGQPSEYEMKTAFIEHKGKTQMQLMKDALAARQKDQRKAS